MVVRREWQMIIGMSPAIIAGDGWQDHVEGFVQIVNIDGVRIPGARRHKPHG